MEKNVQPKKLVYRFNERTRYFDQIECPPGFDKIPRELKIEETRRPDIIQSKIICRGRIRDGKYLFFTGIIRINQTRWHYGDHFEGIAGKKVNSFILFHFVNGGDIFEMFYFDRYKVFPRSRAKFITQFIALQK